MVDLRKMSDERVAEWQARLWDAYLGELIQAGYAEAVAKENVEASKRESMSGGKLAENNFAFDIVSDGETVGVVWLFKRNVDWMIYDIEIDENHRGKGLGRRAMHAIESYVRNNGGNSIGLSVFGFNETARTLYESEGYETIRLSMKKLL
jgi:ribosomal protein S18 acetylase RimI-like enzyme